MPFGALGTSELPGTGACVTEPGSRARLTAAATALTTGSGQWLLQGLQHVAADHGGYMHAAVWRRRDVSQRNQIRLQHHT